MSDSMSCPNCSANLPAGATFCTSCGTRLGESAAAAAPTPPPEDATRVDNPGLHDSTQVFSPPPAAPAAPWKPAESEAAPPAPAWEAPAAPAAPAAPPWEQPAAPAAPSWEQPGQQQPQQWGGQQAAPAAPWQPPGQQQPQQWGGQPAAGQQWGAPPATASSSTGGASPLGGIAALLGGVLTLIGLFTAWIGTNLSDETSTGWSLASGDDGLKSNDPYLILALAIAALVVGVLLFTGKSRSIVRIVAIVAGVAIVGTAARDWMSIADLAKDLPSSVKIEAQFGFYLTIAGGIVTAVSGVLPAKKA